MQRAVKEIQLEITKVQIAKRAAQRKLIRCGDRLTELEEELEKVREDKKCTS